MNRLFSNLVFTVAVGSMSLTPYCSYAQQSSTSVDCKLLSPCAESKATPAQMAKQAAQFRKQHPLLFKARVVEHGSKGLHNVIYGANIVGAKKSKTSVVAKTPFPFKAQTAPLGRVLWGTVMQSNLWDGDPAYGVYSYGISKSMEVNEEYTSPYLYANAGGAISGDRLDVVTYDSSYGTMTHYYFNAKTGKLVNASYLSGYALWATETAVAQDGTVYGDFYSNDATRFELGVVDYSSESRTTIGQLSHYYVALGITKDDVLYGVATDGNLYRIDKSSAKETLVGSTGVKLTMDDGNWNVQSGEIDQKTGIFYWACTDADNNSSLYTVDLTNGKATKVGDMAGNEQIVMLTIPEETVADDAPSVAQNMTFGFEGASLTGTFSFTAPTTTYMGGKLSGTLDYTISVDGKSEATGSVQAGASVSKQLTLKRGNHLFAVKFTNSVGDGPLAYQNRFIGDDIPMKPSDVKASLDASTGKVTLTWNPVTKGINNGYVNNILYNVVRYPDNKAVATNVSSTSLSDQLPSGDLTGYYYTVAAISGTRKGEATKSNSISYGEMLEPPFTEGFDTENALNLFTIIDGNNDGNTWKFCEDDGSGQPSVQIEYGDENHDDWLITPPLKVKAGTIYNVTYRVASKGPSYPELLEVKYGSEPNVAAMTHVLSQQEEITNQQYVTVKKELTVDKDGVLYIGFHCTSDANWCYQLVLDDITVKGNSEKAPDVATDITVTPSADGTNKATVAFKAPTKAIDGSVLTSDLDVSILRDGEEIQEMSAIKPGQSYYYIDSEANTGFNSYSIVAKNSEGTGRESEAVTAYVGADVPSGVKNIKASIGDDNITLTWDAVTTGENGGYVNPSDIEYTVYEVHETSTGVNLPVVDQVSTTTITIPYDLNEGDQDMINYALSASSSYGEGPRSLSPGILVGKPYDIPFEEHFKGGTLDHSMWWISNTGSSAFQLVQGVSADGDNGSAGYISMADSDNATLGSGKLTLKGASNPTLVFSHMSTEAQGKGKVKVYIRKPDLTEKELCVIDYGKIDNSSKEWKTTSVKIDAEYTSLPYVTLTFVTSAPAGESLYLDQIYVRNVVENDLRATIATSEKVRKGETITANVGVTNMGGKNVDSYVVNLYAAGKLVDTKTVNESLAPYLSNSVQLHYTTSMTDASPLELKAEAVMPNDVTPEDNVATAQVVLLPSTKTAPSDVTATTSDGQTVSVAWTKVTETSETVTDDFESYTPWSMDEFGSWTAVYGQKGTAKGPFSRTYPHPNEGKRFAYTLVETPTWLSNDILDDYACLKPYSGNHYLAAFYSVENSQFIVADNWLISPSLPGEKQTVSFWANNFKSAALSYPENFEVLYSTTGSNVADFHTVAATFVADGGAWKEYSVELPAGATYFAIHNNTTDTYMFMVDDITYRAGCGKVTGYNVYRDGKLIKSLSADENSFVDNTVDGGTHRYGVSAVYVGGESEPTMASPVTAIDAVYANEADNSDIYTVDGKCLGKGKKTLMSLPKGIYVVGGKTILLK